MADPEAPPTAPPNGSGGRRRHLSPGLALVGVAVAALVAYAIWAGLAVLRQQPLTPTISSYEVRSDREVAYRLVVTGPAHERIRCAVLARAADFTVVGQAEHTLVLGTDGSVAVAGRLPTLRRAANAEPGACEAIGVG